MLWWRLPSANFTVALTNNNDNRFVPDSVQKDDNSIRGVRDLSFALEDATRIRMLCERSTFALYSMREAEVSFDKFTAEPGTLNFDCETIKRAL